MLTQSLINVSHRDLPVIRPGHQAEPETAISAV